MNWSSFNSDKTCLDFIKRGRKKSGTAQSREEGSLNCTELHCFFSLMWFFLCDQTFCPYSNTRTTQCSGLISLRSSIRLHCKYACTALLPNNEGHILHKDRRVEGRALISFIGRAATLATTEHVLAFAFLTVSLPKYLFSHHYLCIRAGWASCTFLPEKED